MLQGRNVESFDHVQKDLKVEDEDEAAKDPAFFLKSEGLSEDMKRVMAKLYTPDALKVCVRIKCTCMALPSSGLLSKQGALMAEMTVDPAVCPCARADVPLLFWETALCWFGCSVAMGGGCLRRLLSREAAARRRRRCGRWPKPRRQPRPRPRLAAARQTARAALARGTGRIPGASLFSRLHLLMLRC